MVNDINYGDNALRTARVSIGEQFDERYDMCTPEDGDPREVRDASNAPGVQDQCSKGNVLNTLQFVFYGLGAVAVGVGIYILIREALRSDLPADEEEASASRWSLHPVVLNGGGAVAASLRF